MVESVKLSGSRGYNISNLSSEAVFRDNHIKIRRAALRTAQAAKGKVFTGERKVVAEPMLQNASIQFIVVTALRHEASCADLQVLLPALSNRNHR